MNVSFNGLRQNATGAMNDLYRCINEIIENDNIYDHEKEQLIEKFNDAAQFVDFFNCLEDNKVDGDFDCLDIEISRLDDLKEEEEDV